MQCLFNKLIGNMRPVKVARIDVIDSELNNFAQNRDCPSGAAGGPNACGTASCMAPYPMRLRVIDVPGSVKVPPRLALSFLVFIRWKTLVPESGDSNVPVRRKLMVDSSSFVKTTA